MAELSEINALLVRDEREQIRNERPAGAQTGAQRTKIPSALVGRGGVALVMYHLARLGIEFTQTAKDSNEADLWVKLPSGPIVTVEVKTASIGMGWPVKSAQLVRSEVYVFVDLRGACVWIMRTPDLRKVIAGTKQRATNGVYSLTLKMMPPETENAWQVFSQIDGWARVSVVKRPKRPSRRKTDRIIRKTLADGTIKEYRYPPYVPQ